MNCPPRPRVTVALGSCRPGGIDLAFAGLANQTYDDFEVLFVDGRYAKRHPRVMQAAREFGLLDKAVGGLIHVPNHRNLPEGSLWTTPCAGYNTSLMLAAGEIIVFMMDYALPGPRWLEAHVRAHDEGPREGRLVMGPYGYLEPEKLKRKDGQPTRVFAAGDVRDVDVIEQREQVDEIFAFGQGCVAELSPDRAPREMHRTFPDGTLDVTWCHTKNESFPTARGFQLNGVPEWYDRISGPGDLDFGYQLGAVGVQGWCAADAFLPAIDMRWVLTNGSIVIPRDRPGPPPHDKRPYYNLSEGFYLRRKSIRHPVNNHYSLAQKAREIRHWRELGRREGIEIETPRIADEDYFPSWHTDVVRRIAAGEAVTI